MLCLDRVHNIEAEWDQCSGDLSEDEFIVEERKNTILPVSERALYVYNSNKWDSPILMMCK
jgi:hypothetical protein